MTPTLGNDLSSGVGLARKLAETPSEPGVYLMKAADGRILYVGKARSLRKRLAAYFRTSSHADAKVNVLVSKIADVETILTRTEKEALILESNLIKRHRPRFNVVLKDDKRYPSLRLDPEEAYPRFTVVRKIGEDDALYFGPFASAHAVRETLRVINKTFKLRKCKASEFRTRTRPCLHCQMAGCLAPCCRDVPAETYREYVQEAILFLKGRTPELVRKIRGEMEAAATAQDYEKAARLRDKLFALERTTEKQVAVTTDFLDRDVFAAASSDGSAVITHLEVRGGFLTGTRHFTFAETMAAEDEMLGTFIRQFYDGRSVVPGELIVSGELEDAVLIEEWLAAQKGQKVRIHRPERGEKARLLEMALLNAQTELQAFLTRRSTGADLLLRLQGRLNLSRYPERIECVDNSTLMGSEPVAGLVVFVGGRPESSAYRKYRINSVVIPDDYAAMSEILRRRFGKGKLAEPLPDLLMVDGGKGQLGTALAVMRDLQISGRLDVIGIAKKDESRGEAHDKIFRPGRSNPVNFGREGDLLLFLQRVRDEAHRYAVAFHRRRRRASSLSSALDTIPGIGKARKALLIGHFGSFEAIRAATLEELSALPGFNRKLAEMIKENLISTFKA
ncbi:MAG: excinuclease ABC subunit UvrC [Hyphomicrobiales bacterium]